MQLLRPSPFPLIPFPPLHARDGRIFRNPNSEFRVRKFVFLAITVALAFAPAAASAKLAVFTDGRVIKVDDARLEGSEIVLDLKGGGTLKVSAVRIDRVIADEIADVDSATPFPEPDCRAFWTEQDLPESLPFRGPITSAARAADLHPWLVASVVQAESAFDPEAVSRAGAAGLMQLMPAAAAEHDVRDVFDPVENLRGGARHLRLMLDRFETVALALAAYNAGASTVERFGGIPPYKETRDYVRKVLRLFCPED